MAKRRKKKGNPIAPFETAPPEELSKEGQFLAGEILANRKAILKLAALSLDHERRISQLEDAVGELAGEEKEKDVTDVEKDED